MNYQKAIDELQEVKKIYSTEQDVKILKNNAIVVIRNFGDNEMMNHFVRMTNFKIGTNDSDRLLKTIAAIDAIIRDFGLRNSGEDINSKPIALPAPPVDKVNWVQSTFSWLGRSPATIFTIIGGIFGLCGLTYNYGYNQAESKFDKEKIEMAIEIPNLRNKIELLEKQKQDLELKALELEETKQVLQAHQVKVATMETQIHDLETDIKKYKKLLKIN